MTERKDIDFTKAFGDVPASFSHRVEYALRRTREQEEARPMKRKPIVAILITVLCLALTTTAVAAALSKTVEFFGLHYGNRYRQEMEEGAYVPGGQSVQLNDAVFTLDDAVISRHVTEWGPEDMNESNETIARSIETLAFWATGTISVAEEENIILLAEDFTPDLPAGYAVFYGDMYPAAPEGAPTYAELAKEKGAVIRVVRCIPNGIINEETGELYPTTPGACLIPQPDGTVQFSVEIASETVVPEQDSYQLSLYISTQDVDLDGNPIEGTRRSQDWIVTLTPETAE